MMKLYIDHILNIIEESIENDTSDKYKDIKNKDRFEMVISSWHEKPSGERRYEIILNGRPLTPGDIVTVNDKMYTVLDDYREAPDKHNTWYYKYYKHFYYEEKLILEDGNHNISVRISLKPIKGE